MANRTSSGTGFLLSLSPMPLPLLRNLSFFPAAPVGDYDGHQDSLALLRSIRKIRHLDLNQGSASMNDYIIIKTTD
jgi:hypothetical protein